MNTTVIRLDGTVYDLDSIGITTRDFNVLSPSYNHKYENVDGRNGAVNGGTSFGVRSIKCSFYLKAEDRIDYAMSRDDVFDIFRSDEPFYIIDSRNAGKRWFVRCSSSFEPEQRGNYGLFDVEFITEEFPFAESLGTTADAVDSELEIWQFGQGLILDESDQPPVYTFEGLDSFSVYNAGNVTINPRELPLKITFVGTSENLSIKNLTTGDEWNYTGTSTHPDEIILDGVKSFKNGVSIAGETNFGVITLKKGWNTFEITGTPFSFTITFDFRFYYL